MYHSHLPWLARLLGNYDRYSIVHFDSKMQAVGSGTQGSALKESSAALPDQSTLWKETVDGLLWWLLVRYRWVYKPFSRNVSIIWGDPQIHSWEKDIIPNQCFKGNTPWLYWPAWLIRNWYELIIIPHCDWSPYSRDTYFINPYFTWWENSVFPRTVWPHLGFLR